MKFIEEFDREWHTIRERRRMYKYLGNYDDDVEDKDDIEDDGDDDASDDDAGDEDDKTRQR